LEKENYGIMWNVDGAKSSKHAIENLSKSMEYDHKDVHKVTSNIIYHDIFPSVSLEYTLNSNQVKEDILLDEYVENFNMIFKYYLTNLSIKQSDKLVSFINQEGIVIFQLGNLYMIDAENNISDKVNIQVQEEKNYYRVDITADNEWLRNAKY